MFTLKYTVPLFRQLSTHLIKDHLSDNPRLPELRRVAALIASLALAATAALPVSGRQFGSGDDGAKRDQGSGDNKTVITVRTAAVVYVPGPLVKIQVTSNKPVSPRIAEVIQLAIQDGLSKNDQRLQLTASDPDTLISCTVSDHGVGSEVAGRTKREYRKTGERTVHDPTTGMSRTEDEFGYVDVPYRALVLEGRMTVDCEVKDVKTGILLYADRFDPVYSEVLREVIGGSTSPSIDNLNNVYLKLAENAAALILAQLSPRSHSEIVPLPSGKLKDASKLLETDHWNDALDLLVRMTPFKNAKDEAFRLYAIGVAHEGLAYSAARPAEAKRHLDEAVNSYRRATQLKPSEDLFWRAKNRAELSLWQTGGLVAQIDAFEEARKSGSRTAVTGSDLPGVAGKKDLFGQISSKMQPAPTVVRNETVVQWVKSGLAQDYIAASVKHAPKAQFDLSPAEVLKLRLEGVSGRIIKAMQDSQPRYRYGVFKTRTIVLFMALPLLSLLVPLAMYR